MVVHVLVVYDSDTGNTAKMAEHIARGSRLESISNANEEKLQTLRKSLDIRVKVVSGHISCVSIANSEELTEK